MCPLFVCQCAIFDNDVLMYLYIILQGNVNLFVVGPFFQGLDIEKHVVSENFIFCVDNVV
jgi:hypothetical protein